MPSALCPPVVPIGRFAGEEELRTELREIRRFLVPLWIGWGERHDKPVSQAGEGMCRFTSAFLANALGPGWRFDGGSPELYDFSTQRWVMDALSCGFRAPDGVWQPHHWVRHANVIVDLTATQFGAEEIVIASTKYPRYSSNMTPMLKREALVGVAVRAESWLQMWRAHRAQLESEVASPTRRRRLA